jgi:hypothetical protein
MRIFASLRSIISTLFHRSLVEKEIEEELRAHIQDRANDLERSGVPRAEAERRARLDFGGYQKFKEEIREAQGTHSLETLIQDLCYALRMPTEYGVGLNHLQASPPTGPESVQDNPQKPVATVEAQATRRVLLIDKPQVGDEARGSPPIGQPGIENWRLAERIGRRKESSSW